MLIKRSWAIFCASFVLMVSTLSGVFAQSNDARSIIESWINGAGNYDYLTVEHGGITQDAATNVTTVTDLKIRFSGDTAQIMGREPTKLVPSEPDNQDNNLPTTNGLAKDQATSTSIDYSITFPSISFTDLSSDGEFYFASRISAETANLDFKVKSTPANSSNAHGVYRGFVVEQVKWARMPEINDDPNKPISKYFPLISALTDISFERSAIDEVSMSQEVAAPIGATKTNYGRMEIGKAEHGNFSKIFVDGMRMEFGNPDSPAPEPFAMKFKFGAISATDYNYRSLIDAFEPGKVGEEGNNPFATFIGEMTLKDMLVDSPQGHFSMGTFTINDIGIRQQEVDFLGEADRLYLLSQSGGKMPDPNLAVELVGKLYKTMKIGLFEMADMEFSSPLVGRGKLGTYRIGNLSSDGLGQFLVEDVNFNGLKGEFVNLDHFSINDTKFPALSALIGLERATRRNDIAAMMKAMPKLASIVLRGLEVRMPGQANISVGENRIKMADHIGPIPTKVDLVAQDVHIPVKLLNRDLQRSLLAMGFSELGISARLTAIWNEASNVLSFNYDTQMDNAGDIAVSAEVGGVPRSVFEKPQSAQTAMGTLTFNRAHVKLDDRSIVDKGLAFAGQMQGVNAETMKAQAIGMLPVMLQSLGKPGFVDQVTAAVKTFLETKGSISASAIPGTPVSILQLMGAAAAAPGAVIDMLNVKVNAG